MLRILIAISVFSSGILIAEEIVVGKAQAKLVTDVNLPARVAGALVKLNVKEGDRVKAGQELGQQEIDIVAVRRASAEVESKIALLQSTNDVDLRYAKKTLEVAIEEFKRAQLAESRFPGSISKSELARLRLQVDQTTLAIEQAERDTKLAVLNKTLKEQSLLTADLELGRHMLISNVDGIVVELFVHEGEWLNPGDPILRVIGLDQLRIEGLVDANKIGKDIEGQAAVFHTTTRGSEQEQQFQGKVIFVSPEVQPLTGQARIWAVVENPGHKLRPGATGRLVIDDSPSG